MRVKADDVEVDALLKDDMASDADWKVYVFVYMSMSLSLSLSLSLSVSVSVSACVSV